ncbi:lycopene cyclase family protein [Aquimarina sp. RZ0]|uniref:lycopene cyclase family protein n=1 Tax=Aquimarina sp. RZ0 TaxID=2607730 RepID=UPI0011F3885E|nr:lycopene cyclase family protein [Aquimarina sp. RZ0]KAA1247704.1 lycopene cyclase [Aquimarina sp. RZ0]
MQKYDYIIIGGGASGLMLAYRMAIDSFFDQKQVLIIDKENKDRNDRTWCFWEEKKGTWDAVVSKKWDQIFFGSDDYSNQTLISPYSYKLIRSKYFYEFVLKTLKTKSNVTLVQQQVVDIIDEGNAVEIETDQQMYLGDKVFSSVLFSLAYKNQQKYPVLHQHFIGWFIKTEAPAFDSDTATFMDFKVPQEGNTRFMYVLPLSETEALFEYTLFSEHVLEKHAYENEISRYLEKKGIENYTVIEKEKGCIPMTCYEFRKQNSENVLYIGTAGGWTKPSTGYTFKNASKKTKSLIAYIKKNEDVSKFDTRTKFWYYDLLFLDLLYKENQKGAFLFSRLFKKNKITKILKFLDEETSLAEDLKIARSMPSFIFLKMIWYRIFNDQ